MIAQGDAFHIPLPDESVHCICTSPPYYGLRRYSGDQGIEPLGLESSPERHIERMVELCRELWRILRPDGVLWWNYGDSYAGGGRGGGNKDSNQRTNIESLNDIPSYKDLPAGSLIMMPHRVALALQQDGWIIRQDLVWSKPNPMPESIAGTRWVKHRIKEKRSKHARDHNIKGGTQKMLEDASVHQGIDEDWVPEYVDCPGCEKCIPNDGLVLKRGSWRHTRAHEFIFQLTKKMNYYSNQEAVREIGTSGPSDIRKMEEQRGRIGGKHKDLDDPFSKASASTNIGQKRSVGDPSGRNPRSVLDIPTQPYKGSHYATFPVNLIAPLIRATCPRWACPVCGQGWAPIVEQPNMNDRPVRQKQKTDVERINVNWGDRPQCAGQAWQEWRDENPDRVLGYRPTCEHEHTQEEAVPGIVFDPFVGSGTTVAVAQQLLRRGIGIDISMEYLDQQAKVRAGLGTPSNALDDLPLFSNNIPAPPLNKQDSLGKRTYTGFNARWKEQHE